MKTFTNLAQLDGHNHYIANYIRGNLDHNDYHEDFMWSLGGNVHIVDDGNEYLQLLKENVFFDISEDINDSWHLLVVVNNNSGGPSYFVSRDAIEEATH